MYAKHGNWSTSSLAVFSETWLLFAYTCIKISPALLQIVTPPPHVQESNQVASLQSYEQLQLVLS